MNWKTSYKGQTVNTLDSGTLKICVKIIRFCHPSVKCDRLYSKLIG